MKAARIGSGSSDSRPHEGGDRLQRFEALVSEYSREIRLFLGKLCGNHHDAEELAQDVFVKAFRKIETLRDPLARRRWLYTIAINHFNDWIRPKKRRMARAVGEIGDYEVAGPRGERPSRQAMTHELSDMLLENIIRLPERQRVVLLMFSAKGFNYADIAEALGITVDAVKMSLFHAREKLRRSLNRYLS